MSFKLMSEVLHNDVLQMVVRKFTKTLRPTEANLIKPRIHRMFDHCMNSGKMARSCLALDIYRSLTPNATESDLRRAARISSSVELEQSFYLVMDDIMDHSEKRRGKPCWYKVVGMEAINHGLQLDLAAHELVWSEMRHHPKLFQLLHDVHEAKIITITGQELDGATKTPDDFTWDRYEQIVHHKTSHYSYTLPIRMGFHMADRVGYETLTPLTYKIGHLFQSQDDFLDCFGDINVTGKNGTDLAEGKCTWLSCKTLELLNARPDQTLQRQFLENFGRPERTHVEFALEVMKQLDLARHFCTFEAEQIQHIEEEIESISTEEIKPILRELVKKMRQRKK